MALVRNIGGVGESDAQKVLSALRSRGGTSHVQPVTRLAEQQVRANGPVITPNVLRIGSSVVFNDSVAVADDSVVTNGFIAAGIVAAALMFGGGKTVGKKKRSLLLPAAIIGAGALWYMSSNSSGSNDPELDGLVILPGKARLSDKMREAVFARAATWVNPNNGEWYPGIYKDVLLLVLPQYADKFRAMTDAEATTVYQFVIDNPAGVSDTDFYNVLQGIKQKYNLVFY